MESLLTENQISQDFEEQFLGLEELEKVIMQEIGEMDALNCKVSLAESRKQSSKNPISSSQRNKPSTSQHPQPPQQSYYQNSFKGPSKPLTP